MTERAGRRLTRGSGYVELLRPPNLVTAAGDVLAGFAVAGLATPARLPWLLLSTCCLYGGGVVLNDVFDREVDRVERPERPLPSGRVSVRAASLFGGGLLTAGVVAAGLASTAAAVVASAVAGLVLAYDGWSKRHHLIGPFNMGLCRAANLSLGMALAPGALRGHWFLLPLPLTYITAVTAVSRGEVHGGKRGVAAWALLFLALVVMGLASLSVWSAWPAAVLVLCAALAVRVLPPFWSAWQRPEPRVIRHAVKTGVLSLVLLDAVIGVAYAGPVYGAAMLVTALAAGWLARTFAVT